MSSDGSSTGKLPALPLDETDPESIKESNRTQVSSYCPICLDAPCRDQTLVHPCLHSFCFVCIGEWARQSALCPLCKGHMEFGIHEILDDDVFKKFYFPPPVSVVVQEAPYGSPPRRPSAFAPDYPRPSYASSSSSSRVYRRPRGRSRRETLFPAEQRHQRSVLVRKLVYKYHLFAKHVGANPHSKYRPCTPDIFQRNPEAITRLRPWIRRDLTVILNDIDVELIIQFIEGVLTKYSLQTEDAVRVLKPFLHDHTEHFIHELVAFARSPFTLETYEQLVQYDWPDEAMQTLERGYEIEAEQRRSGLVTNSVSDSNQTNAEEASSSGIGTKRQLEDEEESELEKIKYDDERSDRW